jgi:hypothetical protein
MTRKPRIGKGEIEKYRNILREISHFQPKCLDICRKHKFIFSGKDGRWEKLAFTFYSEICEINSIAKNALWDE